MISVSYNVAGASPAGGASQAGRGLIRQGRRQLSKSGGADAGPCMQNGVWHATRATI